MKEIEEDGKERRDAVYDPGIMLDAVKCMLQLRNDKELADRLGIGQSLVSKVRHKQQAVSASLLIRMHEETNLSIAELRRLMGDRRKKYRFGEGKPFNRHPRQPRSAFAAEDTAAEHAGQG